MSPNRDHSRQRLLFLGDSLIEYFDWQGRFPGCEVHNLGISGETVHGLHGRLGRVLGRITTADHVFIMSGINNLAMGDNDFIETYRSVIRAIAASYPSAAVHIHTLLPVLFPYIPDDEIRLVNTELCAMGSEAGAHIIDLHSAFLDEEGRPIDSYLLEDGVHVSEEGYRVWSEIIENLMIDH